MFTALFRPRNGRRESRKSPFSSPSPVAARRPLLNPQDGPAQEHDDDDDHEDVPDEDMSHHEDEDGDEDEVDAPLLPIFSAAHLDKLPLYNITHSCRILIVQKCETTLSWDQLRSPQVSQFVVKPIQQEIRANHFNRATICALIANCLQFQKEAQLNPGNAGVSKTRAMTSELLAMRLLKEFTTRELIDTLSYDFDPLEGVAPAGPPGVRKITTHGRGARISTVEIAIRAQAKRFLAHPLVVQQLEAIWAGTIVFHSAADNLHRKPKPMNPRKSRARGYGAIEQTTTSTVARDSVAVKQLLGVKSIEPPMIRRSVTLYDPRDASLFKLSRLRVPRYRQIVSTISFTVMLGLFLAVLLDRSLTITPLEVVFWFWSAGYMLDEVVGFSEQGFGLYIMSVWNAFDLGILALFFAYYILRLYGVLIPDTRKHTMANMAYDVLASTAVLLFPRAFSVLDHYRYFSQLLIAFRMMAQDMVAILVLIIIACSGFFVAFTLSFSDENTDGPKVAYALFQLIMGFTPAAWEMWPTYNVLGKFILTGFLFICHFLIVTILITVLTNSFMAVVQNANEEHQFLFAVNTISMVKSDSLFSYIPPTNLLGWVATPFRWIMPFRLFVKLNRTVIKVTHFPVLLIIFSYERLFLARSAYEPTDLVERRPRSGAAVPAFSLNKHAGPFSPGMRLREPSIISVHKDRALDEVFRRPYPASTTRTTVRGEGPDIDRRRSTNVVDHWMQNVDGQGGASPPQEQPRSILERLENRRPGYRRAQTVGTRYSTSRRDYSTATRSVISDPEDTSTVFPHARPVRIEEETALELSREDAPQETDADGDDELVTNDEGDNENDNATATGYTQTDLEQEGLDDDKENITTARASPGDYLEGATPIAISKALAKETRERLLRSETTREPHRRIASSNTILFQPVVFEEREREREREVSHVTSSSASETPLHFPRASRPATARHTNSGGTSTPIPPSATPSGARKSAKQALPVSRSRPILPGRGVHPTAPNIHFPRSAGDPISNNDRHHFPNFRTRAPSFTAIALDLASDLGDNKYGPDPISPGASGIPNSLNEQLLRQRAFSREMEQQARRRRDEQRRRSDEEEEKSMVGRIMLARMNTLEEGFREVLREVKDLANSSRAGSEVGLGLRTRPGSAGAREVLLGHHAAAAGGGASTPRTTVGASSTSRMVAAGLVDKVKRSPKKTGGAFGQQQQQQQRKEKEKAKRRSAEAETVAGTEVEGDGEGASRDSQTTTPTPVVASRDEDISPGTGTVEPMRAPAPPVVENGARESSE